MISFILCVKHFKNCYSYNDTWKLLENTLLSVSNQTANNFEIIVVANKILDKFKEHKNIKNLKFVEVDWNSPTLQNKWQIGNGVSRETGQLNAQYDKGTKYIKGLQHISETTDERHYIMPMDADDFIHKNLLEYVNNNQDVDVFTVERGFILDHNYNFGYIHSKFNQKCGTCNIVSLELLKTIIDFKSLQTVNEQHEIVNLVGEFIVKKIFGAHIAMYDYFKSRQNVVSKKINFSSVVYNCSHEEQHSNRQFKCDLVFSNDFVANYIFPNTDIYNNVANANEHEFD